MIKYGLQISLLIGSKNKKNKNKKKNQFIQNTYPQIRILFYNYTNF